MSESAIEFWNAVGGDGVATVELLLNGNSSLVHERYFGIAWKPEPVTGSYFTNTALHCASVNSRIEMAKLLIQRGADVNAIGYEENKGLTPSIVLAAWEGSLEMLQLLLESGADPNIAASAETALYCAAEHGELAKVELLLEHGAQLDIFSAAILGDVGFLKKSLTAYRPLLNARSMKRNRTVREEAEHHKQADVIKLLQVLE